MMLPPLHSVAVSSPPEKLLTPTACPALLVPLATLSMDPGKPPKLMMPPPLHSVAHWTKEEEGLHWACAEPAVPTREQPTATIANPSVLQIGISPLPPAALRLVPASSRPS